MLSSLSQFNYVHERGHMGNSVRQTQMKFQPQGWYNGGAVAGPNQYIRFDFRSDGFWDPKTVYINIEVDASAMPDFAVYQLDNSAQSLISQYIARINGVELVRHQEYDGSSAFLYDMHIGVNERDSKHCEGAGKHRQVVGQMTNKGSNVSDIGTTVAATNNSGGISITNVVAAPLNSLWRPWMQYQGPFNDVNANILGTYGSRQSYMDIYNMEDSQGFEPNEIVPGVSFYTNTGPYWEATSASGFGRMNTEASVGGYELALSKYILKPTIKSGLCCYERSTRATFNIPLLCPLFGVLAEHGKLLPMKLLEGLEFEFLINPYAFFAVDGGSSPNEARIGTNRILYPITTSSAANNIARNGWGISKFELSVELSYPDTQTTNQIYSNLNSSGFHLDFKTWFLGPKIKYLGGASLNNTIQINNGFNSLIMIAFYFQPADYEIYNHCRKHKRISQNLTSIQLRLGSEYFPSLPIVGHGGNLRPDYTSSIVKGSYLEFYTHTMKAFGKYFGNNETTLLNPTNFTLNCVGYNPAQNIGVMTGPKDNVMGMPLYWENQCIPRCLYAIDLEKFDNETTVNSGWNTVNSRPFDLLLSNDNGSMTYQLRGPTSHTSNIDAVSNTISDSSFPRPFYLYIWMYYDARVSWTQSGGWSAEGRV